MSAVVAAYGTPTYVVDEMDVRSRLREYAAAFGPENVAYAGKALLCRAVARWVAEEGLGLYVGSAGELHVARAVGVPAARIVLYGNAKTPQDLQAAYAERVGTIVVESLSEISRLAATAPLGQRLLLRVLTGMEVADGVDRRFGLRIDTDEALGAVARIGPNPASTWLAWTVPSVIRSAAPMPTSGKSRPSRPSQDGARPTRHPPR